MHRVAFGAIFHGLIISKLQIGGDCMIVGLVGTCFGGDLQAGMPGAQCCTFRPMLEMIFWPRRHSYPSPFLVIVLLSSRMLGLIYVHHARQPTKSVTNLAMSVLERLQGLSQMKSTPGLMVLSLF